MKALVINCSPVRTGATEAICGIIRDELSPRYDVKSICIDDYYFAFCKGCRACHQTASCVMDDAQVIRDIMNELDEADVIVSVAPSYWADVPGQFKAFIDRCTPWCNTHEPHAKIKAGKKGYAVALRTGPNMPECERLIGSIGQIEAGVEEKAVVDHLYRSVKSFTAGHPQSDDITIMSLSL